jgi:hypothetical protein
VGLVALTRIEVTCNCSNWFFIPLSEAKYKKETTMKKVSILPFFLVLLQAGFLSAQTSNLIFFSENGEKFTIVMNGLRYNEAPSTNVRLTDLAPAVYKVKAIFEDPKLGVVSKTIPVEPYKETTFNIRLKKQTAVGKTATRMTRQVGRDLNMVDSSEVYADPKETYVMRFISEIALPAQQQVITNSAPNVYNTQPVVVQSGAVTQTTTTTTTVRGTSQPVATPGASVNMSVNDPDLGVNINMNVGVPSGTVINTGGTVQQTTTTTTISNGHAVQGQPAHYIMPGYNGPIGCQWPMDQNAYRSAVGSISKQSFEENKLQVARQVFSTNCLTSAQVGEIMRLFTFEDSRLDFAKFAYGHTFDLGNYFMVNDAFTFSSSVDELNDYIRSTGR